MAFKSGDKRSANFRDANSQVTQRQMIISNRSDFRMVRRNLHVRWRLAKNCGLPCTASGSARNDKNQRRMRTSAFGSLKKLPF